MVAGDHHHPDAGGAALGDGLRARRGAPGPPARPGRGTRNRSRAGCRAAHGASNSGARHAEHAQALARHARHLRGDRARACAASRWHRSTMASGAPLAAIILRAPVGRLPDARHGQHLARQRVVVDQRPVGVQVLGVGQQALRRRRRWPTPSGRRRGGGWPARRTPARRAAPPAAAPAPALRRVVCRRFGPQRAHRHAVGGQRAGLVDAQHGGGAQQFDGRDAARQHLLARQPPGAQAQEQVSTTGSSSGRMAMARSGRPAGRAASRRAGTSTRRASAGRQRQADRAPRA